MGSAEFIYHLFVQSFEEINCNVEFWVKIQVSQMEGFAFLEDLSWEGFNEGTQLIKKVEQFKIWMGNYPNEVLLDKIIFTQ